jgi:hypothetical protein
MTFKVDEIVWDAEENNLGVVFEGEPTEEEAAVVSAMMQAFARLIQKQQEEAEKIMAKLEAAGEQFH